jgi:CRISPR/Cas system-associated exonuclease Cas4 (RecB family)
VELKRGKCRENKMHQIQLALTALCLKEMFPQNSIKKAVIFFCEDRQRQEIILTDNLLETAKNIALEIHQKIQSGLNPKNFPMHKDTRCNGCCFYDLCHI